MILMASSTNSINASDSRVQTPVPVQQNSLLLGIPTDLIVEILTRLKAQDIGNCGLLCRQLNQILRSDDVWMKLFYRNFPSIDSKKINSFHQAYKDQHRHYLNLKNGLFSVRSNMPAHRALFADGKLYSSNRKDNVIEIWDLSSNTCLNTLIGQKKTVMSFACAEGKLFIGYVFGIIEIWDLSSNTCINTLMGHTSGITSLAVANGKLISSSQDYMIKIWDLNTNPPACSGTLEEDEEDRKDIISLIIANGKLISNSHGYKIKIWDLNTNPLTCTAVLEGHEAPVSSFVVADGKLFSASYDKTIKIWDLRTNTCIHSLEGHSHAVMSLVIADGGTLVSASIDSTIIWDLKTNPPTPTAINQRFISEGTICFLAYADWKLILGKAMSPASIWDFAASHETILEELVSMFENDDWKVTQKALLRFARMPITTRNKIYAEYCKILKLDLTPDHLNYSENQFHTVNEKSENSYKAKAIQNYLQGSLKEDSNPLLQHLGIVSSHDYSIKLGCRPAHLEKIGILSQGDLNWICSSPDDLQKLTIIEVTEKEDLNCFDNSVKAKADQRNHDLSDLSVQLSDVVSKKIQETNTCGVLLYDEGCPWTDFQNRINAFRKKINEITERCNTAKKRVEAFKAEKFNELAVEINDLVEEFHILDRDHQIAKLHAYINQWGVLRSWTNLNTNGIQSLSQLMASDQPPQNLFKMGE